MLTLFWNVPWSEAPVVAPPNYGHAMEVNVTLHRRLLPVLEHSTSFYGSVEGLHTLADSAFDLELARSPNFTNQGLVHPIHTA